MSEFLVEPGPVSRSRRALGNAGDLAWTAFAGIAGTVDRRIGWDKLPKPLGLLVLVGLRHTLRKHNLYDTNGAPATALPALDEPSASTSGVRSSDGSYNDLAHPRMGQARTRFGRNVPLDRTWPEPEQGLLTPNPREISRRLMTRSEFRPATSVNTLAATWIQFMVKDWFSHGHGDATRGFDVPLAADDPWQPRPMIIPRTVPDPTRPAGDTSAPPTYANLNTAWWDGSSIYGNNRSEQKMLRSGVDGKLRVSTAGLPVVGEEPSTDPSREPGFWTGLAMMGTLFYLEHNAVCDRLRQKYPDLGDEELFQRSRLVVSALLAKIHTVEWTPAVIAHPTTVTALRANWFGLLGEKSHRAFGRTGNEVLNGIPGSGVDHFGTPYSLTEEFTIVYRMHPLIPDDYTFRSAADGRELTRRNLRELSGPAGLEFLRETPMADLLYSFGVSHPGAIVLKNFPRFLQEFERPDGKLTDLAATDILRTRELGVPRYNEFRRLLHLTPVATFADLTDDPALAAEMSELYGGDVERIDTIVGMFAEKRPAGFAFSDTAFRVFILMASRRINSDRFLAQDMTEEVYTRAGLDWVRDNGMASVLLRHYPQLKGSIPDAANPFSPWTPR